MTDWAYAVSDSKDMLKVDGDTVTIPEGVHIDTLTATDVSFLVVDGSLGYLTGSATAVTGTGHVELIEKARINCLEVVFVDEVSDSSVDFVSRAHIDEAHESAIEYLGDSAHIGSLHASSVHHMNDNSYIGAASSSFVAEMFGYSRISFLDYGSHVAFAGGNAFIECVASTSTVGVVEGEAVVRCNRGVVNVARGIATVVNEEGGFVDRSVGNALVSERRTGMIIPDFEGQCRHNNKNLLVYKVTNKEGVSGASYGKPTRWAVGATVTCDDWDPRTQCGGGLHVSATIADAITQGDYRYGEARFFLCEVDPEALVTLSAVKAKAPSVHVVAEVDRTGKPL